ncbi:MAG: hypothetical protein JWP97_245 [Labilithrix sp.]|nr:hypothetical protein [Labilithrix sp.]
MRILTVAFVLCSWTLVACGQDGTQGPSGVTGAFGPAGGPGSPGAAGAPGQDGESGAAGQSGTPGVAGVPGPTGPAGPAGAAAPSTAPVSGARIKAQMTTTTTTSPDGASHSSSSFGGWYDAQRGEVCSPGHAADGKTRCLPAATPSSSMSTAYIDAACTQTVLLTAIGGAGCDGAPDAMLPKYLSTAASSSDACAGFRISSLGPRLAVPTLYFPVGGQCFSMPTSPNDAVFAAGGAEIPASEFAELTTTVTTTH